MASSGENFRKSNLRHILSKTRVMKAATHPATDLTSRHVIICRIRISEETKENACYTPALTEGCIYHTLLSHNILYHTGYSRDERWSETDEDAH